MSTKLGDATGLEQRATASALPVFDTRVVLFTVSAGTLFAGIHRGGHTQELPRGFPAPGESLDVAARRIVRDIARIREQYIEQLYTFSMPAESESWSVIVSYLAIVCSETTLARGDGIAWRPASEVSDLSETDRIVLDYAIFRLRAKLSYTTIAFHLLPETFTMTELQNTYESVLAQRLDKRNFRRRMIASGVVTATPAKRREGSHRPATLYRFRAGHDAAAYLTPEWAVAADGVDSE